MGRDKKRKDDYHMSGKTPSNGKGSKRRPTSLSIEEWNKRYDAIFGNHDKKKEKKD